MERFTGRVRMFCESCWNVLRDVLECFVNRVGSFYETC